MKRLLMTGLLAMICSPWASAAIYSGNGQAGFGGPIGGSTLELVNSGSIVTGTLTRGGGDLNDAFVIYFDTGAGGFSTTGTFDDAADGLRRAISGFDGGANRSTLTFNTGFDADYALAMDSGFAGVWGLAGTGSHNFIQAAGLTPTGNNAAATFSFSFDISNFGLVPGDSFDFVGTYLNSGNAFRSNEGFGDGLPGTNIGQTPASYTNQLTFTSVAIPEPSSLVCMVAMGGFAARRYRRR